MSADDLRRFLALHGTPGSPTEPGLYVIHRQGVGPTVARVNSRDWVAPLGEATVHRLLVSQYAPLPPLAGRFEACEADDCERGHIPCDCAEGCDGCDGRGSFPCSDCGPSTHPLAAPGVRWVPDMGTTAGSAPANAAAGGKGEG